jgi:chromosome segregation ATPase
MTLLSQNEEMMARLKVLATRLAHHEEETKHLTSENLRLKKLLSNTQDQLSVWNEKQKHWTAKESQISELSLRLKEATRLNSELSDQIVILQEKEHTLFSKESEYTKTSQDNQELVRSFSALSDQLLIWKEKEKTWIEKNQQIETRYKSIEDQIPNVQKLQQQVERYKKFQDKVKNQVKPYIKNLKSFAQNLMQELESTKTTVQDKSEKVSLLEQENQKLKTKIQQMETDHATNMDSAIESIESERLLLEKEVFSLRESNQVLRHRSNMLDRALEKQDEVENELIALRRQFDDSLSKYREELAALKQRQHSEKQELVNKRLELTVATESLTEIKQQLENVEEKNQNLETQMTSLRFMWQEKCEESERLKSSLHALENLNKDISQKLNDLLFKAP